MQSWTREREVEKLKPMKKPDPKCVAVLDAMDAYLSNDTNGLLLEDIIGWRDALATALGIPEQSWFERTGTR